MTIMKFLTFDLETTGVDVANDRIVEIAIFSVDPESGTNGRPLFDRRINPGRPIPKEASDIHGITDADVKDCPNFRQVATTVASFLEKQVVVGFKSNTFDVPILCEEMARAGEKFDWRSVTWIDAGNLYTILDPRTLAAAVEKYIGRQAAAEHAEKAHGAAADAAVVAGILQGMVERHPEILGGKTPQEIATIARFGNAIADPAGKFYRDANGAACYAFGKHKGLTLESEIGYARWMLGGDFPMTTKQFINQELSRLSGRPKA